jgi:large subunit ribosomal protein L10
MNRTEKEQIIAEFEQAAVKAKGLFFTDFAGLTVEQATELRRDFRKSGVSYTVVKNTLIRKALEKIGGFDQVFDSLAGPTGVALSVEDPVEPAKIIHKFATKHSKLSLKSCVLERQVYDGSKLEELAKLPTRKEIIAGVLGVIGDPIGGVATVLNAVMRDLVSVIDELSKKKAA